MGVIAKQSIKNLFSSYMGFIIGGIYTAILVPQIFSTSLDEWGSAKLLLSYAMVMMPWVQLSFPGVIIKFFPNQNKAENSKLLSLILFWLSITILFSTLIINFFPHIFYNDEATDLFKSNVNFIIPILIGAVIFELLSALSRAKLRSILPIFLKEFVLRLYFLIIIVLYGFKLLDFDNFIALFSVSYIIIIIPLLVNLLRTAELKVSFSFKYIFSKDRKNIYRYAFFLLLNTGAAALLLNIDSIMISRMIGIGDITIYTTWFFLATILLLPTRAITSIASTVISENMQKNNLDTVNLIYKKTSITPFIFSLLLFILISFNIDLISLFFGKVFSDGKYVFFFIALGNLSYTISSVNGTIISLSKYYHYDIIFQSLMIIAIIITNYILIPIYGVVGAALATFLSVFLINTIRFIFVYFKFGMHPFSIDTIKILAIGVFSVLGIYLLGYQTSVVTNIIISATYSLAYIFVVYQLHISEDYNGLINQALKKIKLRK